jgi:hypothetical protein
MHKSITGSPIVIVVQPTLIDEVELRSIMLFILLSLAFIAILTLRAHVLAPLGANAAALAPGAPLTALAVKSSSPRPDFWRSGFWMLCAPR